MSHPDTAPVATGQPSPWVARHAALVPNTGQVLDLAAGSGRHTRYFKGLGHAVLAADRDVSGLADMRSVPHIEILEVDLESGAGWPFQERRFAGIVITNYLHRPLLPFLGPALQPGGILIYETFAAGNERFGRPSNPDFLLQPGELLSLADTGGLTTIAYEHGEISIPRAAVIQHITAQKPF